jgi:hypothetical protein
MKGGGRGARPQAESLIQLQMESYELLPQIKSFVTTTNNVVFVGDGEVCGEDCCSELGELIQEKARTKCKRQSYSTNNMDLD